MSDSVKQIHACRSCGSTRLKHVLDLGTHYVSNFVESSGEGHRAPLLLVQCEDCTLVQLAHTVPSSWHYENGYWYRSGTNEQMVAQLRDVARAAQESVYLYAGDVVCDIGCNDGTIFRCFDLPGLDFVGFEPDTHLAQEAEATGAVIFPSFFPPQHWGYLFPQMSPAKLILGIAMFYDLDNPGEFLGAVKSWLHPEGAFVVQMAYAPAMIRTNDIGNISHEHLCYYTVRSFASLLNRHGLKIDKVEFNDVNGGSFRCFIRHGTGGVTEDAEPCDWDAFGRRMRENRRTLLQMLRDRKERGETVAGYGASTRGNTILQVYGITPDLIPYIAERNPAKWGKTTVGSGIPIISEEEMRQRNPDWLFCLPFHLIESFKQREPQWTGRWIVPLPFPHIQ